MKRFWCRPGLVTSENVESFDETQIFAPKTTTPEFGRGAARGGRAPLRPPRFSLA